ncbi:MAG: GNAT family N-acetyltransferase [Eubacterium sp.]
MKIKFIKFSDPEFESVMIIRNTVFEQEQGAIAEQEIDEYDKSDETRYAIIYDGCEPVATGRIAQTPNGFKIGRIAVLKSQRGKGLGSVLVNALCDKAIETGAEYICVDSQLHAVGFYEKHGFKVVSDDEIIDRGIRHLPMRKDYD